MRNRGDCHSPIMFQKQVDRDSLKGLSLLSLYKDCVIVLHQSTGLVKISATAHPRTVTQVTMAPAIRTPAIIDIKECLNFRPIRKARREPVQAPVIGSGIATKSTRPNRSYLSTISPRRLVMARNHWINLSRKRTLLNSEIMASRNLRRKGTGNTFPIKLNR